MMMPLLHLCCADGAAGGAEGAAGDGSAGGDVAADARPLRTPRHVRLVTLRDTHLVFESPRVSGSRAMRCCLLLQLEQLLSRSRRLERECINGLLQGL